MGRDHEDLTCFDWYDLIWRWISANKHTQRWPFVKTAGFAVPEHYFFLENGKAGFSTWQVIDELMAFKWWELFYSLLPDDLYWKEPAYSLDDVGTSLLSMFSPYIVVISTPLFVCLFACLKLCLLNKSL